LCRNATRRSDRLQGLEIDGTALASKNSDSGFPGD
jgi:hypothetical protein